MSYPVWRRLYSFTALAHFAILLGICFGNTLAQAEQRSRGVRLQRAFTSAASIDGMRLLVSDDLPHTKIVYLWSLETGKELQRFEGHREVIRAVAFSPDGKRALTAGGREEDMGSFSTDNSARLWDIDTGKEIRRFNSHEGYVHTVQYGRGGTRILTAGRDSTARLWDVASGTQLLVIAHVDYLPPAATFSSDSDRILTLNAGGRRAIVWDVITGEEICRIEWDNLFFRSAEFSPDDRLVVTAASDFTARTWDAKTGEAERVLVGHSSYVHHAAFSEDGERIITASDDETVRLWDPKTGMEVARFKNPGPVRDALLNCTGNRLIVKWSARRDVYGASDASLWDVESARELLRMDESTGKLVGFTPDGKQFVTTRGVKPAALWDAETGDLVRQYK